MKQALLIGCGNKRGSQIVLGCKEAGYSVIYIGSSASEINDVQNIVIEWDKLDIASLHKCLKKINHDIDFIFFNQNSSSLCEIDFTESKKTLDNWSIIKSWTKSYWLSCQLPYFLLHTIDNKLKSGTIIGWMLSGFIDISKEGVEDHPDYSGYKFTNYLLMRNFNKKFPCFGINPSFSANKDLKTLVKNICLNNVICNGEIF